MAQGTQTGVLRQPRGVGWGERWEGGPRGGISIYLSIYLSMGDPCQCMAETNTIL